MNQLFTRQDIHHTPNELADVVPGLDNQVTPQGDGDEERERARLAALWLTAGLKAFAMSVDPIDWHIWGLQADVIVNGIPIGDLLTVYTHFRQDDFLAWLRFRLTNAHTHVGTDRGKESFPMNQLFTGQDTHNASIAVVPCSAKTWDQVPAETRHLYGQMATSLNCQEALIRAWRELQAVPSYVQRYQRSAQEE